MHDLIKIHSFGDFKYMRRAGRLAADCLDAVEGMVIEGISTEEIDDFCHEFIVSRGAVPATLGYRDYPKSCCTSVNHVVCHGIPSKNKVLRVGDICNIDVTVIVDGWHGDTSRTFMVGEKISLRTKMLVEAAYQALMASIEVVRVGGHFGDIGAAVVEVARRKHYAVVRDFCGHGIGRVFHAPPNVLHFGKAGAGPSMAAGMFFTIEPMINAGRHEVKTLDDNWTAVTCDGKPSAQFEHTIGVHEGGVEVFTLGKAERERFFTEGAEGGVVGSVVRVCEEA